MHIFIYYRTKIGFIFETIYVSDEKKSYLHLRRTLFSQNNKKCMGNEAQKLCVGTIQKYGHKTETAPYNLHE